MIIAQFTDLHYQNGEAADTQTHRVMSHVLDAEKPDLVVLTGDVIDGSFCRDPIESWANAVQPIVERQLPWAAVFGNHDDEGSASRSQLMAAMQKLPGCLSQRGPAELSGVGNYVLPIDTEDGVKANLFFLDSHANADQSPKEYDWIKQNQIDWYLAGPHDRPALMFFHIPLPEYAEAWNIGKCVGSRHEPVCSPKFNSGLFNAIKTAGDVTGVFVGHDHTNDYASELVGITLCYGRATGFATYGRDGFARGARMIKLTADARRFETWVSCLYSPDNRAQLSQSNINAPQT